MGKFEDSLKYTLYNFMYFPVSLESLNTDKIVLVLLIFHISNYISHIIRRGQFLVLSHKSQLWPVTRALTMLPLIARTKQQTLKQTLTVLVTSHKHEKMYCERLLIIKLYHLWQKFFLPLMQNIIVEKHHSFIVEYDY